MYIKYAIFCHSSGYQCCREAETEREEQQNKACRPGHSNVKEVNRREDRQQETCQSIGRILRFTFSMVTKPFILWLLLQGRASMEKVRERKGEKRNISSKTNYYICRTNQSCTHCAFTLECIPWELLGISPCYCDLFYLKNLKWQCHTEFPSAPHKHCFSDDDAQQTQYYCHHKSLLVIRLWISSFLHFILIFFLHPPLFCILWSVRYFFHWISQW